MKRIFIFILVMMLTVPAFAEDQFLDDFNVFAVSMYGISRISPVFTGSPKTYASDQVEIIDDGKTVTLTADIKNIPDLIAAACCALRTIDNSGDMLDQYGRVLHAYFMCRSAGGEEKRATTDSSVKVYVSMDKTLMIIRLVR